MQITRLIKRTMKRDRHPIRSIDNPQQPIPINFTRRSQHPNHNRIRPRRLHSAHIAQHDREVIGIIDKRPAVRPHNHIDGNRHRRDHGLDHPDARRQPALARRRNQFKPIRTAARSGHGIGNRRRDDFEHYPFASHIRESRREKQNPHDLRSEAPRTSRYRRTTRTCARQSASPPTTSHTAPLR